MSYEGQDFDALPRLAAPAPVASSPAVSTGQFEGMDFDQIPTAAVAQNAAQEQQSRASAVAARNIARGGETILNLPGKSGRAQWQDSLDEDIAARETAMGRRLTPAERAPIAENWMTRAQAEQPMDPTASFKPTLGLDVPFTRNARIPLAPQNSENFASRYIAQPIVSAGRGMGQADANIVGLVAPEAAARARKNMALAYYTDPGIVNSVAEGAGGMIPSLPFMAIPGGMPAYMAAEAMGRTRTNIAEARNAGQDISGMQELGAMAGHGAIGAGMGMLRTGIAHGVGNYAADRFAGQMIPTIGAAAGGNFLEGAALHAPLTMADNAVDKYTYAPDRSLTEGVSVPGALVSGLTMAATMTPFSAQHAMAVNAGHRETLARVMPENTPEVVRRPSSKDAVAAESIAAVSGSKPVWFAGGKDQPAGFVEDGQVYLNSDRPADALAGTAVHELQHSLRRTDPESAAKLESLLRNNTDVVRAGAGRAIQEAEAAGRPDVAEQLRTNRDKAIDEGMSQVWQDAAKHQDFLKTLHEQDPTLAARVGNVARGILDAIGVGSPARAKLAQQRAAALDWLASRLGEAEGPQKRTAEPGMDWMNALPEEAQTRAENAAAGRSNEAQETLERSTAGSGEFEKRVQGGRQKAEGGSTPEQTAAERDTEGYRLVPGDNGAELQRRVVGEDGKAALEPVAKLNVEQESVRREIDQMVNNGDMEGALQARKELIQEVLDGQRPAENRGNPAEERSVEGAANEPAAPRPVGQSVPDVVREQGVSPGNQPGNVEPASAAPDAGNAPAAEVAPAAESTPAPEPSAPPTESKQVRLLSDLGGGKRKAGEVGTLEYVSGQGKAVVRFTDGRRMEVPAGKWQRVGEGDQTPIQEARQAIAEKIASTGSEPQGPRIINTREEAQRAVEELQARKGDLGKAESGERRAESPALTFDPEVNTKNELRHQLLRWAEKYGHLADEHQAQQIDEAAGGAPEFRFRDKLPEEVKIRLERGDGAKYKRFFRVAKPGESVYGEDAVSRLGGYDRVFGMLRDQYVGGKQDRMQRAVEAAKASDDPRARLNAAAVDAPGRVDVRAGNELSPGDRFRLAGEKYTVNAKGQIKGPAVPDGVPADSLATVPMDYGSYKARPGKARGPSQAPSKVRGEAALLPEKPADDVPFSLRKDDGKQDDLFANRRNTANPAGVQGHLFDRMKGHGDPEPKGQDAGAVGRGPGVPGGAAGHADERGLGVGANPVVGSRLYNDATTGRPTAFRDRMGSADTSRAISQASRWQGTRWSELESSGEKLGSGPVEPGELGNLAGVVNKTVGTQPIDLKELGLSRDPRFADQYGVKSPVSGLPSLVSDGSKLIYEAGGSEGLVFKDKDGKFAYKFIPVYRQGDSAAGMMGLSIDLKPSIGGRGYDATLGHGTVGEMIHRVEVNNAIGGIPTEIVGMTSDGYLVTKLPFSWEKPRSLGGDAAARFARLEDVPSSVIDVPGNWGPVRATVVNGDPYLVADVRSGNVAQDSTGKTRPMDSLVTKPLPEWLEKSPELREIFDRLKAQESGKPDRSDVPFSLAREYPSVVEAGDKTDPNAPYQARQVAEGETLADRSFKEKLRDSWRMVHDSLTPDNIPALYRAGVSAEATMHAKARESVGGIAKGLIAKVYTPEQYREYDAAKAVLSKAAAKLQNAKTDAQKEAAQPAYDAAKNAFDNTFAARVHEVLNKDNILDGYYGMTRRAVKLREEFTDEKASYAIEKLRKAMDKNVRDAKRRVEKLEQHLEMLQNPPLQGGGGVKPIVGPLGEEIPVDKAIAGMQRKLTGARQKLDELTAMRDSGELPSIQAKVLSRDARNWAKKAVSVAETLAEADRLQEQAKAIAGKHDIPQYEKDVKAALADPQMRKAIDNWKEHVNPEMDTLWRKVKGLDPEAALPTRGRFTGARVNLLDVEHVPAWEKALSDPSEPIPMQKVEQLQNSKGFKRDRFESAAAFTGDYSKDPEMVLRTMLGRRLDIATKQDLFNAMVRKGLAVWKDAGDVAPEAVGGVKAKEIAVDSPVRKVFDAAGNLVDAPAGMKQEKRLYVREDLYPELSRVLDTNRGHMNPLTKKIGDNLTKLQVAGLVDFVTHGSNLIKVAGASPRDAAAGDLIARIPGVGTARGLYEVSKIIRDMHADAPEIRQTMLEMGKQGLLRGEYHKTDAGWLGRLQESTTGKALHLWDNATRVLLYRRFQNLQAKGVAPKDHAELVRFVQQVGEYNHRLQGAFAGWLKNAGLSPFVVAGRTMNRQARRMILGDPGFKATSTANAVKLRAIMMGTWIAPAASAMLMNYVNTNSAFGRPGTPLGAIDTGKDDERGRPIVIDLLQLAGVRRGMRQLGIDAAYAGVTQGKDLDTTIGNAVTDAISTSAHPWFGPAAALISKAVTGKNVFDIRGRMEARNVGGGGMQYLENARAALESQNPLVYNAMVRPALMLVGADESNPEKGFASGLLGEGLLKPAAGAVGYKTVAPGQTAAQDLAMRHYRELFPNGLTPEQMDTMDAKSKIREAMRTDPAGARKLMADAIQSGKLSQKQAANLVEVGAEAETPTEKLARLTKGLPYDLAEQVYTKGTSEEKAALAGVMGKKREAHAVDQAVAKALGENASDYFRVQEMLSKRNAAKTALKDRTMPRAEALAQLRENSPKPAELAMYQRWSNRLKMVRMMAKRRYSQQAA